MATSITGSSKWRINQKKNTSLNNQHIIKQLNYEKYIIIYDYFYLTDN